MSKYQALIDALNGDDSLFSNVRNGDVRALLADLERAEGALKQVQRILRSTPYHVDKDELFAVVDAALAQMAGGGEMAALKAKEPHP